MLIFKPALLAFASGARPDRRPIFLRPPGIPKVDAPESPAVFNPTGEPHSILSALYYFDQLIGHNNPENGTFRQRFVPPQTRFPIIRPNHRSCLVKVFFHCQVLQARWT